MFSLPALLLALSLVLFLGMANSETKGVAIALFVEIEVDGTPTMVKVAARRGLSFEKTLELFDVSTADNRDDGPKRLPDMLDWSASVGGLLLFDEGTGSMDASQERLDEAQDKKERLLVEVRYPGGYTKEGLAFVTNFGIESNHDAMATYSGDLTAAGPLTKK